MEDLNEKFYTINKITPTDDNPFVKINIGGEDVLLINPASKWVIDHLLIDYKMYSTDHEFIAVILRRKD